MVPIHIRGANAVLPARSLAIRTGEVELSVVDHQKDPLGHVENRALADELRAAMRDEPVSDPSLIPVYDEIRNHMGAIEMIRESERIHDAEGSEVVAGESLPDFLLVGVGAHLDHRTGIGLDDAEAVILRHILYPVTIS